MRKLCTRIRKIHRFIIPLRRIFFDTLVFGENKNEIFISGGINLLIDLECKLLTL